MKRNVILTLGLYFSCAIMGQTGQWLITPEYDNIRMATGADLLIADSVGSHILWTFDGKRIGETPDEVRSFTEGYAVTIGSNSASVTGFYNETGKFTKLDGCMIANANPHFSDGFLLVRKDGWLRFVDTNGTMKSGMYESAEPFRNGYARCMTYRDTAKKRDKYILLLSSDYQQVPFVVDGKTYDDGDVNFISSVNDESIGVVVLKERVFLFNGKDRSLTPVFARRFGANDDKRRNQARFNKEGLLYQETDSTFLIVANCGKTGNVEIRFDDSNTPISIKYEDEEYEFKHKQIEREEISSPLKMTSKNGLFGIYWDDTEIFPPQFDEFKTCFDDKAVVKLHEGKYGLLKVMKNDHFKISINKGEPIPFRHKNFETIMRVDLPSHLSPSKVYMELKPECGCELDLTSREAHQTEGGSYVQYNCALTIPSSLPDELYRDERNLLAYPLQVRYDDLLSPVINTEVMAWYIKYMDVEIVEKSVENGNLIFTFEIKIDRNDDKDYPIEKRVVAAPLEAEMLMSMTATKYKWEVYGLQEGTNEIVIELEEDGCPPIRIPFEVSYTKEEKKNKQKPEETLEIKRVKKPKPKPEPKPDTKRIVIPT